jgi:hypothetical protein
MSAAAATAAPVISAETEQLLEEKALQEQLLRKVQNELRDVLTMNDELMQQNLQKVCVFSLLFFFLRIEFSFIYQQTKNLLGKQNQR